MAKRWQQTWPRGRMVDHPAVIAETRRDNARTRAQLRHSDGLPIVLFQRPRVYVDRDAWEMLPPDGVLLMRVRPTHEAAFDLVFTPQELENVFGEVRDSASWDDVRCYHWKNENTPRAVASFRVAADSVSGAIATNRQTRASSADAGGPAAARPTSARRLTLTAPPTPRRASIAASRSMAGKPASPFRRKPPGSRLEWARGWFAQLGQPGESDEYLAGVEAWRAAWRPERVKVLLLAESHVAEAPGDARVCVRLPSSLRVQRQLPTTYVRLVYCLGYGDNSVCSPVPATANRGTPDYWDIFERIAASGPRHANEPLPHRQLERDIAVLERLAERGIWLEDASPVGIYQTGGGRLTRDSDTLAAIEREGYENYVWPGVAGDAPAQVWVIGRTVAKALRRLSGIRSDRVIMQPSYVRRVGAWEEYERELTGLCRELAAAAP